MRSRFAIYLFILLCTNQLFGQYTEEPYVPLDTLQSKKLKIIGLPIAFYTPETNFGFGGGGQVFLLRESNRYNLRKSSILVSAIYTLNNQLLIDLNPEIYLMKGDYLLDMMYRFKIFQVNNLAGRMAGDRQLELLRVDPATIVGDPNQPHASLVQRFQHQYARHYWKAWKMIFQITPRFQANISGCFQSLLKW